MAITVDERTLSRPEYWKRIGILVVVAMIIGAATWDWPEQQADELFTALSVILWPIQVYWGVARCRDIGWHPAWAILNYPIIALIIFGIPKSKPVELRLVE